MLNKTIKKDRKTELKDRKLYAAVIGTTRENRDGKLIL